MSIFWNIGIHAKTYDIANIQFDYSEEEARYIENKNIPKDEEFICEHAYGLVAHAITLLRMLRMDKKSTAANKKQVYDLLNKSEILFKKAIIESPIGHRSLYWLICIPALKEILEGDETLFMSNDHCILDKHSIFFKYSERIFTAIGWIRHDISDEKKQTILEKRILSAIKLQNDSLSLRSYSPNILFCCAVIFWDFVPVLTVDLAIKIIKFLRKAKAEAAKILEYNLCIYSMTRFHGEILPASQFIEHVDKAIKIVESRAGTIKELEQKGKNMIIKNAKEDGIRLCLLNITS
ncbi:hypothetical protein MHK_001549 [Candidatus Magnetomorum sp. HK-1]|nr:hypothetical protein MHK_001549 [Candidatus Magnetomorum sp. HK-1]